MGAASGAASGLSLVSVGLGALGAYKQAQGTQEADEFKAEQLDRAARVGEIQADQTSGELTRRLNQTLGNIDVMRAAAHDDPTSPSGVAYRDFQEGVGVNQRSIAVGNIIEQSRQETADAAYLRTAGQFALQQGELSAGGMLLKGLGGTNFNTFGLPGGSPSGAPSAKESP